MIQRFMLKYAPILTWMAKRFMEDGQRRNASANPDLKNFRHDSTMEQNL